MTDRSVGLDIAKLKVYVMIVGLYYDHTVDYATQLCEEFATSISHTNVADGVSSARYWSLILQQVYKRDGILVPVDVSKVEFVLYQHSKTVEDDSKIFPSVA